MKQSRARATETWGTRRREKLEEAKRLFQEQEKMLEKAKKAREPAFKIGDKVQDKAHIDRGMGSIVKIHDDEWEKTEHWSKKLFYYLVQYEDGSFSGYIGQNRLINVPERRLKKQAEEDAIWAIRIDGSWDESSSSGSSEWSYE